MSFLVAGWSSTLGHDWNQQWLSGNFAAIGFFGLSTIATGDAGGPSGGIPYVALPLFGGSTIQTGFNLNPVPEPSAVSLFALAAATLTFKHRSRKWRSNAPDAT
jgi:hypothetical protein